MLAKKKKTNLSGMNSHFRAHIEHEQDFVFNP